MVPCIRLASSLQPQDSVQDNFDLSERKEKKRILCYFCEERKI